MSAMYDDLAAPFPPEKIHWRVGSTNKEKTKGLALAYVDARDVMQRLDDVVGPPNWQDCYRDDHGTTMCALSIRIGDEWVTKEDGSGDTDIEAEKGAVSKALVRAGVKWGIGRYLYDLESPWVAIEPAGRSVRISKSEYRKLNACLPNPAPVKAEVKATSITTPSEDRRDWHDIVSEPERFNRLNAGASRELWKTLKGCIDFCSLPEQLTEFATDNAEEIYRLADEARHHLREAYDARMEQLILERSAA